MYPSAFDYYRPTTVDEAIKLLQDNPEGKILAGGHSLLPIMKLRLAAPSALIDIGRIDGLRGVRAEGGRIHIGAMTTYDDILRDQSLAETLPVLIETANVVGDVQVRNRGTIGGSMAHADPGSDYPAVMLALNAEMKVVGPNGERTITAPECFVDMFTTSIQPEEILTEIIIPEQPANTGVAYEKFANPASGYAVAGVAASVTLGSDGKVATVRVGVTGACPVASRAEGAEAALGGQEPTAENIKAAAERATEGLDFIGDIHASEEYRAHLVKVFTERALTKAVARARG